MTGFHDDMTLGEAREQLRALVADGHTCPLCSQYAKVYKRRIHATMARELIRIWREVHQPDTWFHLPTIIGHNGGDVTKCGYWGLLEEETDVRRDDGGRAGYWRLTARTEAFVRDQIRVPKYARIYDGRLLGLTGDPVSIRDCLGSRFDYAELMSA